MFSMAKCHPEENILKQVCYLNQLLSVMLLKYPDLQLPVGAIDGANWPTPDCGARDGRSNWLTVTPFHCMAVPSERLLHSTGGAVGWKWTRYLLNTRLQQCLCGHLGYICTGALHSFLSVLYCCVAPIYRHSSATQCDGCTIYCCIAKS